MTRSPNETSSISRYGASFAGPSAMREIIADRIADGLQLKLRDPRKHRQRKDLLRERLRNREGAARVAQPRVRRRQVDRLGVVTSGGDPPLGEESVQALRVSCPDNVEVPDRRTVGRGGRQEQIADALERGIIEAGCVAPLLVPPVEQGQLMQEHDGLDRVEAGGKAFDLVPVLRSLTVLAQRAHARAEIVAGADEGACVSHRAEVLARIEAEGGRETRRAGPAPVSLGAVCLTGVLDEVDSAPSHDALERRHVRHLTVKVNGDDEAGPRCDGGGHGIDIEVVVNIADVDGNWLPAGLGNSLEC